jgi:ribonuclease HI
VHTDGSCSNNSSDEVRAGSGIWFDPDDPRNMAFRMPEEVMRKGTQQSVEMIRIAGGIPR